MWLCNERCLSLIDLFCRQAACDKLLSEISAGIFSWFVSNAIRHEIRIFVFAESKDGIYRRVLDAWPKGWSLVGCQFQFRFCWIMFVLFLKKVSSTVVQGTKTNETRTKQTQTSNKHERTSSNNKHKNTTIEFETRQGFSGALFDGGAKAATMCCAVPARGLGMRWFDDRWVGLWRWWLIDEHPPPICSLTRRPYLETCCRVARWTDRPTMTTTTTTTI